MQWQPMTKGFSSAYHHSTASDTNTLRYNTHKSGVTLESVPPKYRRAYGAGRRCCWTTWMPALCAGVVAVLCYVNSLDGDYVHNDMVAVVGNPDVTGDSRRHASSSSSSLWMNDFWGRPMAEPRSHKSYRPLTVLTFRSAPLVTLQFFKKSLGVAAFIEYLGGINDGEST